MPLPVPGEDKNEFIKKFMGDDNAKKEFPDVKQRLAVAYSMWRKKHGGAEEDLDDPRDGESETEYIARVVGGDANFSNDCKIHEPGVSRMMKLISEGKVINSHPWVAPDKYDNDDCIGKHGDGSGGFPVIKGGYVHRSGVIAAKQRAAQQGYSSIGSAADKALKAIDSKKEMGNLIIQGDLTCDKLEAVTLGMDLPKEVGGVPAYYKWSDALGTGHYVNKGRNFELSVDSNKIKKLSETLNRMRAENIQFPINISHSSAAADSRGFIEKAKVEGGRLKLLMQLIGEDANLLASRNRVSVGIQPDFIDGKGKHWGEAIAHLAITQIPVVDDQQLVQAASQDAASGATILTLIAAQGSQTMTECTMSGDHVSTLRGQPHLNMSQVPESGVGAHLAAWHQTHGKLLDDAGNCVPGLSNMPACDKMSGIVGHLKTLKAMKDSMLSKDQREAILSPESEQAVLMSAIADLRRGAVSQEVLNEKDKEISRLRTQVVPTLPQETLEFSVGTYKDQFDLLVSKGHINKTVADALIQALITDGKNPNAICMSNQSGNGLPVARKVIEALKLLDNHAPKEGGPKSGMQTLSREEPGAQSTPSAALLKAMVDSANRGNPKDARPVAG